MTRDDAILSLKIKYKNCTIKFVDSYTMLPYSLRDLAITYGTDLVKDYFPYKFVTEDTIFYSGSKPDIAYYVGIDLDLYKLINNIN